MVFEFKQEKYEKVDYLVGGTWGLLNKAWKNYNYAKEKNHEKNMIKYAKKIIELQNHLKLPPANFPELNFITSDQKCLSVVNSRTCILDNELVKICKGLDIKNMPEYYADNTIVTESVSEPISVKQI